MWHFWVTGRSRIWLFVMICRNSSQNEALKHTCNNAWHICSFRHRFIDIKLVKCDLSPLRRMRVVGWHERMCTRDVPGQPTNQPTRAAPLYVIEKKHQKSRKVIYRPSHGIIACNAWPCFLITQQPSIQYTTRVLAFDVLYAPMSLQGLIWLWHWNFRLPRLVLA